MKAAKIAAPFFPIQPAELVEKYRGLAAVANADFQHVELFGKRVAVRQAVPQLEQLEDQVASGLRVASIRFTTRQRGLVALARRLLPTRQCFPVETVEPPDDAPFAGAPRFERQPTGAIGLDQRTLDRILDRLRLGAAQI